MSNIFLTPLLETNNFKNLINSLSENQTPILATGVLNSQKSHLIYGILNEKTKPALIVTENELKAKEIYEDLTFFSKQEVMLYPSKDIIFYSADIKSTDIVKKRFEIINKITETENKNFSIVLSVEALFDKLVPIDKFKQFIIKLEEGQQLSIDDFCDWFQYFSHHNIP